MAIKVGINGFGRIGRLVARAMLFQPKVFEIVAVHDLFDIKTLAHLLAHDSTHGQMRCPKVESISNGCIQLRYYTPDCGCSATEGTIKIRVLNEKVGPSGIDWGGEVDLVVESTGIFRAKAKEGKDGFDGHIGRNSCRKVILTVPPDGDIDATIVVGVNHDKLLPEHNCISNASCTTNCLAPIAKVLHDRFRIVGGMMNTIHAATNDQVVVDMAHKDLRRARGTLQNIIPTSTGAAKAIGKVIPELDGKLAGFATRVPVADVSMVDLTVVTAEEMTKEAINAAMQQAAGDTLKGILQYSEEPLVSSDVIGNPHSAVFDSGLTTVLGGKGNQAKVVAWYDNEWGYSCRVADLAKLLFIKLLCA